MKLLKNVKFGENVLCEDSAGSKTFSLGGATINGGRFSGSVIDGATICGGSLDGLSIGQSTLHSPTINTPTIKGDAMLMDGFLTLCGYAAISGGVISGSRLDYVSFTCGDTVSGNYATIENINLSGATFNNGSITGNVDVSGNGQIHLYDNNCIDFTSGGWMQMYGGKYIPQVSGNQLIFVHS